jgi:threonyl-tRNA synthetase
MSSRLTPRERLQADGTLDPHVVAVRANGKIVDLHTPIDATIPLTPIRDTDKDAVAVIRHSTAHVMADAVQRLFPGTHVTIGPAIEDGFYYDFEKQGAGFTDDNLRKIEEVMAGIVRKNSPFRREVIARDEAIRMFEKMGEHFKVEIIRSIPPDEEVSLYRHGGDEQWVDVCEGPHVPSTGFLKAVKLTHVAGAYWRGDERNPMLQRIYGLLVEGSARRAPASHRRGEGA